MSYLFINFQTMLETIRRQTIDGFRFRWNNDKDDNRKYQRSETCIQEHLYRYFLSKDRNGFLNDVLVIFIDKTDLSDPLKREDYLRRTIKTTAPFGLNINSVY